MKTSKIPAVCFFLLLMGAMSVFGFEIKGNAPAFQANDASIYDAVHELNTELANAFNDVLAELNDEVRYIDTKPEKFIQAWGNSSIFSSYGATQRAYGGYSKLAITAGSMIGFQLPASPFTVIDELENIVDLLNDEHDLKFGLNPQILNGQIGVNTSKFLLNNLYLGFRFGYMRLDSRFSGFTFNNLSLGLIGSYQLISQKKLGGGIFIWRGLNLGTGFIYQKTNLGYKLNMDSITALSVDLSELGYDIPELSGTVNLSIDPRLSLGIDIKTFTIPLEAFTSVRLLWFLNAALGFGVDFGFGKSDMKMNIGGDINVNVQGYASAFVTQTRPGNISASVGGIMSPGPINPKLMAGLGIGMGPVIIDVPVTWYFLDHGYNVGITFGVVW